MWTLICWHSVDLVEIEEPCRHDVQFGGMCANCGKDMTEWVSNFTAIEFNLLKCG